MLVPDRTRSTATATSLCPVRTIDWDGDAIRIVDQTLLPHELRYLRLQDVDALIGAIRRLAVRGAPALGVAGALGVALAAHGGATGAALRADADRIRASRPTAVNLAWGVDDVLRAAEQGGPEAAVQRALELLEGDIATNRALAARGLGLLDELIGHRPRTLLTHCNAGGLACVEWGTALGVVRAAHERGGLEHVYSTETRPLLQGARITAFELQQMGIAHQVLVDSAGPAVIGRGDVDAVVVGADRIAANGDVANKIGTYAMALAAADAGIPFVVAAPESTIDAATPDGASIEIEERDPEEVLALDGRRTAPRGSTALNLAFDVTPARLVSAIVTERRVVRPAAGERPA